MNIIIIMNSSFFMLIDFDIFFKKGLQDFENVKQPNRKVCRFQKTFEAQCRFVFTYFYSSSYSIALVNNIVKQHWK